MAVTRRVYQFGGSADRSHVPNQGWVGPSMLEKQMSEKMANADRIAAVVYHDGKWVVFTESFGLGPVTP